jgi:hypothetical protein
MGFKTMIVLSSEKSWRWCPKYLLSLMLCSLLFASPERSAGQSVPPPPGATNRGLDSSAIQNTTGELRAEPQAAGSIRGRVMDQSGVVISGAQVTLTREHHSPSLDQLTDDDGQFFFANVAGGPFQLTIQSAALAAKVINGTLQSGEAYVVPDVVLAVATQVTEVHVGLTPTELAQVQVEEQEKQRVLGFIPNFYVSYVPNAVPLTTKLKFALAWKSSIDPVTFAGVAVVAGIKQATNEHSELGQGAEGYAKRFGAAYADVATGTFIGGAVLPSLLKQDPRYFYKGVGSKKSRLLHAVASTFICKGDNGRWQPNYSNIGGNFAAGGLSTLYYHSDNKSAASLAVSTALIRLGETTIANIFQEFLIPKLTPNLPSRSPTQP